MHVLILLHDSSRGSTINHAHIHGYLVFKTCTVNYSIVCHTNIHNIIHKSIFPLDRAPIFVVHYHDMIAHLISI
jgi:hypothetical protein